MKLSMFVVASILAGTSLIASAEDANRGTASKVALDGQMTAVTATIKSVDQESREVVLLDENGKEHSFIAGDQVRNLAQVHPGDRLRIGYHQRFLRKLYPGSGQTMGSTVTVESSRATLGEKPHGTQTTTINAVGRIKSIHPQSRQVVIEGKRMELTFIAGADIDLDSVQVGDTVTFEYTEGLIISVTAPQ